VRERAGIAFPAAVELESCRGDRDDSMSKRHLSVVLKVAISAGLVYFVFRKVDWRECSDQMQAAFREGYGWLIAAVAVTGIILAVGSWRWTMILRGHDVAIPYFHAFRLFLVGFFFSQFMPGGLAAGDVIRSYYTASCSPDKKMECVATVVLDRVVGSFGMLTVVVISLLLLGGKYLVVCLIVIGGTATIGVGAILFFSKGILGKLPFAGWIYEHLPYREQLSRAYEAFRHYREHKGELIVCWALSVLIHLLLVSVAYCVGNSVGVRATAPQYLVRVPLVGAITALPITFGNIGTAEFGYDTFFLAGHHPEAYHAVVAAFILMMRLLWLFVGAIGGLIWWVEKGAISGRLVQQEDDVSERGASGGGALDDSS